MWVLLLTLLWITHPRLKQELNAKKPEVIEFFRALTLCNTVVPTYPRYN
jgi:hypothetical protein